MILSVRKIWNCAWVHQQEHNQEKLILKSEKYGPKTQIYFLFIRFQNLSEESRRIDYLIRTLF